LAEIGKTRDIEKAIVALKLESAQFISEAETREVSIAEVNRENKLLKEKLALTNEKLVDNTLETKRMREGLEFMKINKKILEENKVLRAGNDELSKELSRLKKSLDTVRSITRDVDADVASTTILDKFFRRRTWAPKEKAKVTIDDLIWTGNDSISFQHEDVKHFRENFKNSKN